MSKYDGVHSCGPNCQEPLCVANRRIEELNRELKIANTFAVSRRKVIAEYQAKVEELTSCLNLLEANSFQHSKPYMVCVPREIWAVAFPKREVNDG